MNVHKLYLSLTTNIITAKLPNQFQWTKVITALADTISLDSESDFDNDFNDFSFLCPDVKRVAFKSFWLQTTYHNITIITVCSFIILTVILEY